MEGTVEKATFGGGCFWCTEAIFKEVRGVLSVIPGYSGGVAPGKPTYREVCSGLTGHAEVIRIEFLPDEVSYETLLKIFLTTHDPTTLNRQGADVGSQYRSVIFYHSGAQKTTAEAVLSELASYFDDPIVTQLAQAPVFYEAEAYHHNYYAQNAEQGYCTAVISPKLKKFRSLYQEYIKP